MSATKRERGAALPVALSIVMIIGIIASVFLSTRRFNPFWIELQREQDLRLASEAVLEWTAYDLLARPIVAQPESLSKGTAAPLRHFILGAPGEFSVETDRSRFWLDISLRASNNQTEHRYTARYGRPLDTAFHSALRLIQMEIPSELVGGAIRGEISSIPQTALFSAAQKMVAGPLHRANEQLRFFRDPTADHTTDVLQGTQSFYGSRILREVHRGRLLLSEGDLILATGIGSPLEAQEIREIIVDGDLFLDGEFHFKRCRIVASGKIEIKTEQLRGELELFAGKTIQIAGKGEVTLSALTPGTLSIEGEWNILPHSILLQGFGRDPGETEPATAEQHPINLEGKITGSGWILSDRMTEGKTTCLIGSEVVWSGVIGCAGTTELQGKLIGHLTTALLTCGSDRPCLGRGTIDREQLPVTFAQPPFLPYGSQAHIRRIEFRKW